MSEIDKDQCEGNRSKEEEEGREGRMVNKKEVERQGFNFVCYIPLYASEPIIEYSNKIMQ